MRYSRETGFGLMVVALLCFLVSAPPWMFLLTGLVSIAFGIQGIRQGREEVDEEGIDGEP